MIESEKTASRKALQKIDSKQRILNVATRLFKKQGYKATGIDQLMAEAGLTAGGFYAHFQSKDDLFEQCLAHALEQSRQILFKDLENLEGTQKVEAILKRYCSVVHRDFPDKGCILPSLASEIHRGSSRSNELIARYVEKWAGLISSHLPDDMSLLEKKQWSLQIISRSVGSVLLSRILKDTYLSESFLLAAQKI